MFLSKPRKKAFKSHLLPIILAGGRGSRVSQLTSRLPKALLPVANMPMIWYPLNILEKNGFKEVTIVLTKSSFSDIKKTLEECLQLKIRISYVFLPDDVDPEDDFGTVDALKLFKDMPERRLLILPCDLVCDNFNLVRMICKHKLSKSSFTMMFAKAPAVDKTPVPRPKVNGKLEKEIAVFDGERPWRILRLASSEGKFDTRKVPSLGLSSVTIHSDLTDCHLYLMEKSVLQLLELKKFMSLQLEFIPWLIEQASVNPIKPITYKIDPEADDDSLEVALEEARSSRRPKVLVEQKSITPCDGLLRMIKCSAYVSDMDLMCIRANRLVTYCEANRVLSRRQSPGQDRRGLLPNTSQMCPESVFGVSLRVGEKVSIKGSVLGNHCRIGDNTKITNCVIMDSVNIGKNVTLDTCILCGDAHIPDGTDMKNCIVSAAQTVPAGSHSNDEFLSMEQMMTV